jgi:hypothetical protein
MKTYKDRAAELIVLLRSGYETNKPNFDFYVGQYVSSNNMATVRQEIILQVTGKQPPIKDCTTFAVSNCLRAAFSQLKLF